MEWFVGTIDGDRWKPPQLADVVRYDPFALPAAFPQPVIATVEGTGAGGANAGITDRESAAELLSQEIARLESELKRLQQQGVRVIVGGDKQAAAVIGDRMIRVGDDIQGFTVIAIEPDGVRVERKLEQ
jgi:hypothetical protein